MGVYLTGVHLMGVHLISVHLMGVYLIGVHFIGVYIPYSVVLIPQACTSKAYILWACTSQTCTS
jgi:hypothetical protein